MDFINTIYNTSDISQDSGQKYVNSYHFKTSFMNCIVIYIINLYALLFIAIPYLSYFKYFNSFDCQSSINTKKWNLKLL